MRLTIRSTFAGAIALLMAATVSAQGQQTQAQAQNTTLTSSDRTFLMTAGQGGHAEVMLAEMAQKKGTNDQVKALAQRLDKDHSANNQELKTVASAKGVTVPMTLDKEHQQLHDRLEKLEGASFDREYATAMVGGHKKMIALYEQAASSKDAQVKAYAEKTLPTLQEHLKMAQQAQAAVGGATSTSGTPK